MIDAFSFGRITVDGVPYRNDIKIINNRVISDWWRQSGHRVELTDVEDVVAACPDILVMGTGEPGMMTISGKLRLYLADAGIQLIEEKTPLAVTTFNRLTNTGKSVSAGIHVGC